MKQSFYLKEVTHDDFKQSFLSYSSIKINNFVDKKLCNNACKYLYENESRIINEYKFDSKGLAIDLVNDKKYIKYLNSIMLYINYSQLHTVLLNIQWVYTHTHPPLLLYICETYMPYPGEPSFTFMSSKLS